MKTRRSLPTHLGPFAAFALAAFAGVSFASAQTTVFQEDFTTVAAGTTINGLVPTVGGVGGITVPVGGGGGVNLPNLPAGDTVSPGYSVQNPGGTFSFVTTDGAQRVINTPFTSALQQNQTITITVNFEEPGGNFFSGGFAGFRLETAATEVTNGGSGGVAFVGDANDDTTGFDLATSSNGGTGEVQTGYNAGFVSGTNSGDLTGATLTTATVTYAYNTGVVTLSLSGPAGTGTNTTNGATATLDIAPDQQIDGLQFENNNGGDQRFSSILATVVTAATGSVTYTGATNSLWDTSTLNFQSGGTPVSYDNNVANSGAGDNVTFDDTATGSHNVTIASTLLPGSVTVNTATSYTLNSPAGSDGIDGGGGVTVQSGTLNLVGTNGYVGFTTVQSGTLSITSGASIGGTPSLILGSDANSTSGALVDNGTAAEATVPANIITAGGSGVTDTITVANASGNLVFTGAVTGTAPLTKDGPGQLTLSGAIGSFTQAINLNAGLLSLGSPQGGVVNLNSASAVLDYAGSGTTAGSINATTAAAITASNPAAVVVLTGNNNSFSGALTYAGPGQVTLSGSTNIVGALTVNGGKFGLTNSGNTLSVGPVVNSGGTLEYTSGALGTGAGNAVTLNGGTLAMKFTSGGLVGNYFNSNPNNTNNSDPDFDSIASLNSLIAGLGAPALSTPSTTNGQANLDFSNNGYGQTPAFASQGFSSTTDFIVQFIGYIDIAKAGVYNFSTTSDDGSILGIDGNLIVSNNNYQGATTVTGADTLTAGVHQIEVGYYQGGGGMGLQVLYNGPGISNEVIPNSVLTQVAVPTFTDTTTVTLNGSSTIDPEGQVANIGSVSFNTGSSLEVKSGTLVTTNGTSFQTTAGGANSFTINVDAGGVFEPVTLAATNPTDKVTINLDGQGSMVLAAATGPLNNAGTVLNLGGSGLSTLILVDQTSLGVATINFNGGGLAVTSSSGGTINFNVPFTYSPGANGAITAGAPGFGVSGGIVNVTNPNVPASSTLFLGSADGYILNVVGTPTGGGNIGISSGLVNIGANGAGSAIDGLGLTFIPASGVTATAAIAADNLNIVALNAATAGAANLVVGTGSATITPVINLNDQGANNTFNGNISSAGAINPTLNKSGAGTLTLGGSGSTLGAVNVAAGGLALTTTGAVGAGNVSLANGTILTLSGASTVNSNPTISGFANNQTNGTNAANAINGSASTATLTVGVGNEVTSVFTRQEYSTAAGFQAQYVYQALPGTSGAGNLADGLAFVVQSQGSTALGGGGGSLGYAGITNSGGLEFNLYPGNPPGTVAFASSGAAQTGAGAGGYQNAAPISLPSGDQILVYLSYDGASDLTETLTDESSGQTYSQTFTNFDLNAALNGEEGYIGFTGADGGANSTQIVSDFSFNVGALANYANSVSIADNASATLQLNASSSITGLTLGANATVNLAAAANSVLNLPYNLTVLGTTTLNGADVFNLANNGTGLGSVTLNAVVEATAGSSLTVNGPGTLTLAGAATYTGATNVNSGTLAVAVGGSISGSKSINVAGGAFFDVSALTGSGGYTIPSGQAVNVASSGTVTGSLNVSGSLGGFGGIVNGSVTVNSGGVFTPGNQGGVFNLNGNFTTNPGGALNIEFGGTNPGQTDSLTVSAGSTISLDGPLTGTLFNGYQPAPGDTFYIVTGSQNSIAGFFSNQSANQDGNGFNTINVAGEMFDISYTANAALAEFSGGGNDIALEALQAVPEPSSLFLLGAGALFGLGRFRRKSAA